jgi:hypothetical protein
MIEFSSIARVRGRPAFHNLQPIARDLGVEVRWRPVLVGGSSTP